MTRSHQVLARVLDAAHQVAEALIGLARHEREGQLTRCEQPHQPRGVTPVGLHPVTRDLGDRSRCHDSYIKPALLGYACESEPRGARLIHRAHRTVQLLQEHRHDAAGLTAQPLHAQLTACRIEHRGNRLCPVNIKPDKGHTLTWSAPPIAGVSAPGQS